MKLGTLETPEIPVSGEKARRALDVGKTMYAALLRISGQAGRKRVFLSKIIAAWEENPIKVKDIYPRESPRNNRTGLRAVNGCK